MKIFEKRNLNDIVYVFFGIYMLTVIVESICIVYSNDVCIGILKAVRYICYLIFAIKIIIDWKNGSKITKMIVFLLILSIIIAIVAKDKSIFFLLLISLALRNMDFKKIVKITLKIFSIIFSITVILSLLKIIPDWTFNRGPKVRHSLGFIYPTDAIGIYLSIVLMFFYIRRNKTTIYELLTLEIVNVILYYYTHGRTSFILITIILTILFLTRFDALKEIFYKKKIQNVLKTICYCLPIALFISIHTFVALYGIGDKFSEKINSVLSDRIKLTYEAYKVHNLSLFGQETKWNGWGGYGYVDLNENQEFEYNYVDSSYPRILLDDGIIFMAILLAGYTALLVKCYKEKKYWLLFVIIFILIWSYIEQYIISLKKNIFALSFIPFLELGEIPNLDYENIKLMFKHKKGKKE